MIHELKKAFNDVTISDLIPITKITSEEIKESFNKKGYIISFLLKDFKKSFTDIDENKIFFQKYSSEPIYYDKEKIIYKPIPLYVSEGALICMSPYPEIKSEESLKKFISVCENLYNKENWDMLLFMAPDRICLELFKNNLHLFGNDTLDIFREIYCSRDYGFSAFTADDIKEIYRNTVKKDSSSQKIRIYRGEGDKSTPYHQAFSWTTDKNVAYRFAVGYTSSEARIHVAEVCSNDILDSFNDRNESEVLVLPEHINLIETIQLQEITSIEADVLKNILLDIQTYPMLEAPSNLNEHEKNHMQRVCFLSLLIGEEYNLSSYEKKILSIAALNHDIGRTHDLEDDNHGIKSYKILKENGIEDSNLQLLVEYHCKYDALFQKKISSLKSKSCRIDLLYKILKDADALDRIRLGIRQLNPNYLRLNSLEYLLIAKQLLNKKLSY